MGCYGRSCRIRVIGDPHIDSTVARTWKVDYFQNCLMELELVTKARCGCDILITTGDLFNRAVIDQPALNAVTNLFINAKPKIFSAIGNHDVLGYNLSTLQETSLGNLTLNRLVGTDDVCSSRFDDFEEAEVKFDLRHAVKGAVVPDRAKLLVSHTFYNQEDMFGCHMKAEDVAKTHYKYIVFGHDHLPYPTEKVGGCTIFRPGAFSRRECTMANLNRKPQYVDFQTDCDGNIVSAEMFTLDEALDSKDLYKEEAVELMQARAMKQVDMETNVVNSIKNAYEGVQGLEHKPVEEALVEAGASPEVVSYTHGVYDKLGLVWK